MNNIKIKLSKSQWEKMSQNQPTKIDQIYNKFIEIIEKELPEFEYYLYPNDVTMLKMSLKDSVENMINKYNYAVQNPKEYEFEHKKWDE
jgi:hypothetical protein